MAINLILKLSVEKHIKKGTFTKQNFDAIQNWNPAEELPVNIDKITKCHEKLLQYQEYN